MLEPAETKVTSGRLDQMSDQPNPLGSLRLFGLADRRLDLTLTVLLIVVVVASRVISFPASIWEQDEAVFAAAVLDFDATDNRPHPPWFPLWIGLGKTVHLLGIDAATSLQLLSCAFSVWILFPLTALWSKVLPQPVAVGSAVLFLAAPGPWFLSGRAFTGTTATALLVAALALWLQARDRPRWLAVGSIVASLAVLVRPHFLPAVLGAMLMIGARVSGRDRWRLLAAFLVPLLVGGIVFLVSSVGPGPLWSALETHGEYHFSRLHETVGGFEALGLSRSLGHPAVAVGWLVLFFIGMIRLIRTGHWREISPILLGALTPILLVVHLLSNPAHSRYAVPLLALTSGLVASGLITLFRRWAVVAIEMTTILATTLTVPQLIQYRSAISPPVAAIDEAFIQAQLRNGVVVADRTLHAFFVFRRLATPTTTPVLFDHMIELAHVPPPPREVTVFVFDAGHGDLLVTSENTRRLSCSIPLVVTLAQDRYLKLTIASGAMLRGDAGAQGPLILID